MTESTLLPLQYPDVWPPPELPPYPPLRFHRFPIIGSIVEHFRWLRRIREHIRTILNPIADRIFEQLEIREIDGVWPESSSQRQIAKIIADVVCLEKGLEKPPSLHPDDPYPLLFWGPSEDLTPMFVRMDLRNTLGIRLPDDLLIQAWNDEWSIQRFVESCDRLLLRHPEQQAA